MRKNKLSLLLGILGVGLLSSTLVFSQAKSGDDAEMILLRTSVIDNKGNGVGNLQSEQFVVREDGVEQEIKFFNAGREPASVLILLDISASSEPYIRETHAAHALGFIRNNPENDYSILAFNDKTTELANWGSSRRQQLIDSINKTVEIKKTEGNTAFFDAVFAALDKFKSSKHRKKVLLIFSDGQDNVSKKGFSHVVKELKNSDVSVFTIAIVVPRYAVNLPVGLAHLDEINKVSGGKSYYPQTKEDVATAVAQIESILNNQYVIGYIPKKPQKDKDWHKIDVRISAAGEKGRNLKADIIARTGYFARKK